MQDRVGQQPQSIEQDHPPVPSLHIHLLGDFLLVADENPVATIAMPRLQSLLAYLLLHRTAPQSRTHMAFLPWPDSTEEQAHTNLRKVLYTLRQTFPHADSFLLLLDDLQWCDTETLEWLHYLLRFDPQAHFLLLGTMRLEETMTEHPLMSLLLSLRREGAVTD